MRILKYTNVMKLTLHIPKIHALNYKTLERNIVLVVWGGGEEGEEIFVCEFLLSIILFLVIPPRTMFLE